MADPEHEDEDLDDPDAKVATPIAYAVGHLTFSKFSDQAVRSALAAEYSAVERGKLYALGMTGSPALDALARSESRRGSGTAPAGGSTRVPRSAPDR